ncbi:MAG: heme ABC exporter ATP-binding protein CcmA [Actinomycetota bacterium]|nr:heme ABC exporter ATP-binding protein CcmA [Actinomycetota bacterium]
MTPVIDLQSSMVLLGRFPALTDITMTAAKGEIIIVKGPNGAGKSTLLRLCAGLLPLKQGKGSVLGFDIATERMSIRPHVGMLGHKTGLYPDLTVKENMQFWAQVSNASPADVISAINLLGLDGRLESVCVRNLSEGQRRRVSLATLVVQRPRLWLLDEPHAALDAEGKQIVDSLILQAVNFGATVMVASHEIDKVGENQARIIKVAGGAVVNDTGNDYGGDQDAS